MQRVGRGGGAAYANLKNDKDDYIQSFLDK